jgi:hypothetical protein
MINKKTMTPKTLQAILIASIIASIIIGAIGFSLIKQFLTSYSTQVSHAIGDSAASANNVETLQTIKKELVTQQSNELTATEVISPIGSYQSQVITDLSNYANLTGITIQNYTFVSAAAAVAAPVAAVSGSPALSLPTQTVTITIASPVGYTSLLEFIRAIEGNLPKMILSNVVVSRATSGDADSVSTTSLTIAVFTR